MIPYGRQWIDREEAEAVLEVLRSDFLTQGPVVERFENAVAGYCGARFAVAVSSGTSALHAAYAALGIGVGDEIVTTPITFAATTNAALYLQAKPVFADCDPKTGLIDPEDVARKITPRTKAIVPVDFSGAPCDYAALESIARKAGIALVADAAHSLGGSYRGRKVGTLAEATTLSFHPVKTITSGEGGMVLTDREDVAVKARQFRHHGMERGQDLMNAMGGWYYEVQELGNNYRLSDLHAAVGLAQLGKIDRFLARREEIAQRYLEGLASIDGLGLPETSEKIRSAWHLFVIRLEGPGAGRRREVFERLRNAGIGVQVHYIPVYWHPLYRKLGYTLGLCPGAEEFYSSAISLPIYPRLSEADVDTVIRTVQNILHDCAVTR